jgi:hypothetical protein
MSFRFREQGGSTVLCESVNLRCSLVMEQVWSPDLQVCGELICFRVSPNKASGLELIRTHYGQEKPKSLQDKVSGVICFPLCAREEDPLPPLHSPHPFYLCLCLDVWQMGGMGGGQSKNTPQNFKRGFNGDYGVKLTPWQA